MQRPTTYSNNFMAAFSGPRWAFQGIHSRGYDSVSARPHGEQNIRRKCPLYFTPQDFPRVSSPARNGECSLRCRAKPKHQKKYSSQERSTAQDAQQPFSDGKVNVLSCLCLQGSKEDIIIREVSTTRQVQMYQPGFSKRYGLSSHSGFPYTER